MENDKDTDHGDNFSFNKEVTSCFSDMLKRSIPQYDLMRDLTVRIAKDHIKNNSVVLDIGTSTGEVINSLINFNSMVRFIGLENSDPMLEEAIKRFVCYPNVKIIKHDLRNKFSHTMADVIISSLTIQFTPIEYRLQILKNIYDNLSNDGVFLFIEKVIGSSANINNQFINIYYGIKRENGYSEEEIQRKKFALEGVLVPVTAKWNEEMLKVTGFKEVDCFWRCLNFAGWIAYK